MNIETDHLRLDKNLYIFVKISMPIPPVLLIGFKRPETTRAVLSVLRQVKPDRLYYAVDGARSDNQEEIHLCGQVRSLAETVDWPCEVFKFFREKNRGCRRGVSEAITWFFDHESEGIILEDDCVPHPDFFLFAGDLLERYRYDTRVMAITGDNYQESMGNHDASYYFSIFNHVWGWASWRRAWELYDTEVSSFNKQSGWNVIERIAPIKGFSDYWVRQISRTKAGKIDTWDYIWTWSCWKAGGLTCTPRVNMVKNIGFGEHATNTLVIPTGDDFRIAEAQGLDFPLIHPKEVISDALFDRNTAIRWKFTTYATPKEKALRQLAKPLKRVSRRVKSIFFNVLERHGLYRFKHGFEKPTLPALLKHVALAIGAQSYLEIGARDQSGSDIHIPVPKKVSVNPNPDAQATHIMTSDAFFESHAELKFDLVFIGGDHTGEQLAKDIRNSLAALNEGGYVLIPGLNPTIEFEQLERVGADGVPYNCCATSWQGFVKYRVERDDLDMFVVDTDDGFGVIRKGRQTPYRGAYDTHVDLAANRAKMLNLISVEEFLQRV